MTWKIRDNKTGKEALLENDSALTVGNTEECDIFIDGLRKTTILCQIFLEDGFLFRSDCPCEDVFYHTACLRFAEQSYVLTCEKIQETFLLPTEKEICEITFSADFKSCLFETQSELAKSAADSALQKNRFPASHIFAVASFFLSKVFWQRNSIYQRQAREKFQKIIWCLWAQIADYGVLSLLLRDETISEIMVNDRTSVYVERKGVLQRSLLCFESDEGLMTLIERICTSVGRRIDESLPFCDARLPDGSRVHAIIPPLALNGPCLTIRKFPDFSLTIWHLRDQGAIPHEWFAFLKEIVETKKNILISGGTGSGKTTLLNCLSSFIPEQERILTIEDSAELKLQQKHVIRLESRHGNVEQKGAVTMRELVRNALRMRPDRIIVGECRGGEALDMLQAMNTGHDGSLTTIHANSPLDALRRLETLVLFAASDLPAKAIREQIASAIEFVIQQTRLPDGKRCVTSICQIVSLCEETQRFVIRTLYERSKEK